MCQPASLPACQPASLPACQPSQPANSSFVGSMRRLCAASGSTQAGWPSLQLRGAPGASSPTL
eukprot:8651086-Heterocapsa_arctica.AAC.1